LTSEFLLYYEIIEVFRKVTGILLKPREFDTVLIPLVCNKQRIFIRDSFHKGLIQNKKPYQRGKVVPGLSLLSFKVKALRQISTFAFEKDLLVVNLFILQVAGFHWACPSTSSG
jgi:hypothetical protein